MGKRITESDCCVVCGRPYTTDHKCPRRTLAAIEAAERRVDNWYDPTHPSLPPDLRPPEWLRSGRKESA